MRVYICPQHPEKPYSSWRKFRGHWSTQHRGEECPPREEFLQEVEKGEFVTAKKEFKEAGGFPEEKVERPLPPDTPRFIGEGLPDDPVPRLSTILDVHGVDPNLRNQVLGIFQIHPGYKENPVNLHYLLTAKLPRKFHPSIPMMISAFTSQEGGYPEGMPIGMIQGGMGPGAMPPYMMGGGFGGGYPPFYGMPYPYPPPRKVPIGSREDEDDGERVRRRSEGPMSEMKEMMAMMGAMFEFMGKVGGSKTEEAQKLSEDLRASYEGLRDTLSEVMEKAKEEKDAIKEELSSQMKELQEGNRATLEAVKEQLHEAEKARLEDRISTLEQTKEEERSEGIGSLLKEAGEGLGAQMEGMRGSITQGVDRLGSTIERIVSVSSSPIHGGSSPEALRKERTPGDASRVLEAESQVEELAKALEGIGQSS